jgi:replication factor C subunit 1
MVRIVGEQLGYQVVQSNASELRNKSSVSMLLNHLVDNQLIQRNHHIHSKFLILMDEVDGMTGTDRGGLAAIVENIKVTKTPIVCICNDKES